MSSQTRTTDSEARLVLPPSFANATVVVEQISETEVLIRRTDVVPDEEFPFVEEAPWTLSDRDRDQFLEALANPPAPNAALINAANRHRNS